MSVIDIRDHLRDQREERKDLELARLHEVIDVMRQYCEMALKDCMHSRSCQAVALNRAIGMADRTLKGGRNG